VLVLSRKTTAGFCHAKIIRELVDNMLQQMSSGDHFLHSNPNILHKSIGEIQLSISIMNSFRTASAALHLKYKRWNTGTQTIKEAIVFYHATQMCYTS